MPLKRPLLMAAPFALALLTSCAEEPAGNLFDESGVFALTEYSLNIGDPLTPMDDQTRGNAFLMFFSPDHGIMAAGSCASQGGTDEGITSSICNTTPFDSEWVCRCYAYEFDGDLMSMQYFAPGEDPPTLSDTDGDESDNDPSDTVETATIDGRPNAFEFRALPGGLFDSDGENSRYVFERKANSVWNGSSVPADLDDDGESELDWCSEQCFGEVL